MCANLHTGRGSATWTGGQVILQNVDFSSICHSKPLCTHKFYLKTRAIRFHAFSPSQLTITYYFYYYLLTFRNYYYSLFFSVLGAEHYDYATLLADRLSTTKEHSFKKS